MTVSDGPPAAQLPPARICSASLSESPALSCGNALTASVHKIQCRYLELVIPIRKQSKVIDAPFEGCVNRAESLRSTLLTSQPDGRELGAPPFAPFLGFCRLGGRVRRAGRLRNFIDVGLSAGSEGPVSLKLR
jgi:hypothetical protein